MHRRQFSKSIIGGILFGFSYNAIPKPYATGDITRKQIFELGRRKPYFQYESINNE